MSETVPRIRWAEEGGGDAIGFAGTASRGLFTIWAPRRDEEEWAVTTGLPGKPNECRYGADRGEVEAEAEEWLEEFASSLGAIFPEPGQAVVTIEEEGRPAAFLDEHDIAAVQAGEE